MMNMIQGLLIFFFITVLGSLAFAVSWEPVSTSYLDSKYAQISDIDGLVTDVWINQSGDVWTGDMDAGGYRLTNLGRLVVSNITFSGDIIPSITELFSIGNETNWVENIFVKNLYADRITSNIGNITNLSSENFNSDKGDITNITTNEMNMGGIRITNESGDLILVLTG